MDLTPGLTTAARAAARSTGRRLAGTGAPPGIPQAFEEVAIRGAEAALRVTQVEPVGKFTIPQSVRSAAERRHTKRDEWPYGSRILWGSSHVDDRTFARECVNLVLAMLRAEEELAAALVPDASAGPGDPDASR